MKKKRKLRETAVFTTVMLVLVLAVAVSSWVRARSIGKISYQDHMEDTAVTIDGRDYKFRDLAVYLARQEMATEDQARVYDLEHTDKYWNVHANGSFIRLESRDYAMDTAVHDMIFYQMAVKAGVSLTAEEMAYLKNQTDDFWSDLEEEGRERIGVSIEEVGETFLCMGLAEKQQKILAEEEGVDSREYNVNGSAYENLLCGHTYEINEKLWDRLDFGKIVLD